MPEIPAAPPPSEPTIPSLQKELAEARQQYRAVSQYLWIALEALRGESMEITLRTDKVDPLWQLMFLQVNDAAGQIDPNQIQILAATLPPLDEQQKKRLVRRLRGTNVTLVSVLQEQKLTDYPPHYVEKFLSDRIKWDKEDKVWKSSVLTGLVNTDTE